MKFQIITIKVIILCSGGGYGNSYGGLGLRAQWRMGEEQSVGIHAGVGYLPYTGPSYQLREVVILASAGVKFFPYKDFYINTQFGLTGYESYSTHNNITGRSTYYGQFLYGPSFLVGGDWTWGDKVGYGFNAGLGLTSNINAKMKKYGSITLALDLGFIIRF